jgi:hypothetical protein
MTRISACTEYRVFVGRRCGGGGVVGVAFGGGARPLRRRGYAEVCGRALTILVLVVC